MLAVLSALLYLEFLLESSFARGTMPVLVLSHDDFQSVKCSY